MKPVRTVNDWEAAEFLPDSQAFLCNVWHNAICIFRVLICNLAHSFYTLFYDWHMYAHAQLCCSSTFLIDFWDQTYALVYNELFFLPTSQSGSSSIWWHWHITTVLTELSWYWLLGSMFTSLLCVSVASQLSFTIIENHQERLHAHRDQHNT